MLKIIRTDSTNNDFIELVKDLDQYLAEKDGDEHSFYAQYNKISMLQHVVIAYENETAVGCGAIKDFNSESMEVKRMFTLPSQRGKGIASKILQNLENWIAELGYKTCVLETGIRQQEAVEFYKKSGYLTTPNYGQYQGIQNSLCFEKKI